MTNFPRPTTKKDVKSFLGLTGYYRKFIPQYASLAAVLTDLTRKKGPNRIVWTQECELAFSKLKNVLCSSPVLESPDFTAPFILQTDASDRGVGAVLSQLDDKSKEHPIAYFSKKLKPIFHCGKRMLSYKAECSCFPCLPVGTRIYHRNRSSCFSMARQHEGEKCTPHQMEPQFAAIPVYHPLQTWERQRECRRPLKSGD